MLAIKIVAVIFGVVVVVVVVGAALVVLGHPGTCSDRPVAASAEASAALQSKWSQFKAQAATRPASVTFNEAEVTSRGREFLRQQGVEVDDLQVHLCSEGYAQATGVYTGAGMGIDLLVQGTLDLSGPDPRLDLQKVQAGNAPGFVTTALVGGLLKEDAKALRLGVRLKSVQFSDGRVDLAGGP